MCKQGQLIAVNGVLYEYGEIEDKLHKVYVVDIDEEGILTATYSSWYLTDAELSNRGIDLTQKQWYGIVEHFIRQDYDLTEMQIKGAVMDIVDRCFAYGIPKIHELADYIAEYLNR